MSVGDATENSSLVLRQGMCKITVSYGFLCQTFPLQHCHAITSDAFSHRTNSSTDHIFIARYIGARIATWNPTIL